MIGLCERGILFLLLFAGFLLLFRRVRWLRIFTQLIQRTRKNMDETSRIRLLENRRRLMEVQKEHSLWVKLEQELQYSGLKAFFPFLTLERWAVLNLTASALILVTLLVITGIGGACVGVLLMLGTEYLLIQAGKQRAMRSVNDNLLKFLDFLSNYSITAGEVTSVFHQVSKYVEEPLQSVLEECCMEAQTTGDTSLALLSMAEKIEHPKFKEIIRNLEISIRYCADFTTLVSSSRRSVREYLRLLEERKGMLMEAVINMGLLLGMSVFVLLTVDRLIAPSIWMILRDTLPGHLALSVIGFILLLFLRQLADINR